MKDLTLPIFVGVLVFAASQYFLKLILEPIINFRKLLSEISHAVLLNQISILKGGSVDNELQKSLAALSAQLRSYAYLIPFYSFWSKLYIFSLPKKENILLACRELNWLSFGASKRDEEISQIIEENNDALKRLSQLLNIETTYIKDE
jgi:hypothetical protein